MSDLALALQVHKFGKRPSFGGCLSVINLFKVVFRLIFSGFVEFNQLAILDDHLNELVLCVPVCDLFDTQLSGLIDYTFTQICRLLLERVAQVLQLTAADVHITNLSIFKPVCSFLL